MRSPLSLLKQLLYNEDHKEAFQTWTPHNHTSLNPPYAVGSKTQVVFWINFSHVLLCAKQKFYLSTPLNKFCLCTLTWNCFNKNALISKWPSQFYMHTCTWICDDKVRENWKWSLVEIKSISDAVYFFSLSVIFPPILCCKVIHILSLQVQSILFSHNMCPQGIQTASVTDSGADTGFQRRGFKIRTAKGGAL